MNWIEVSLQADGEAAEAIADLLQQYGYQGVAIEQLGIEGDAWEEQLTTLPKAFMVRAYLPANAEAPSLQHRLESGLGHLRMIDPRIPARPDYQTVQDEDWAEAWKAHYRPLHIGEHLYVRPAWAEESPGPGDVEIVLDPGMAFGTGTHPSTQLCLIALEAGRPVPPRVLDLGCGSGILAIAAAKLGAVDIWAVDTDELAVKSTVENAALNNVSDLLTIRQGSLADLLSQTDSFDLILVNILAKVIIPMCQAGLASLVKPGGVAIFSGLIEEQADEVEAALRDAGLIPFQRLTIGDWIGIQARRE